MARFSEGKKLGGTRQLCGNYACSGALLKLKDVLEHSCDTAADLGCLASNDIVRARIAILQLVHLRAFAGKCVSNCVAEMCERVIVPVMKWGAVPWLFTHSTDTPEPPRLASKPAWIQLHMCALKPIKALLVAVV